MTRRLLLAGVLLLAPLPRVSAEDAVPGPALEPSATTGRFKVQDVERLVRDELDRRSGVEVVAPPVAEVGGLPTDKLGDPLPEIPPYKVADLVADPAPFVGGRLLVIGLVRRTASDGAWVEIAEVPSAADAVRIVAQRDWRFFSNTRPRRVTAFGLLKRQKLTAAQARQLDEQSGKKLRPGARVELVLEAEGAIVQWLD